MKRAVGSFSAEKAFRGDLNLVMVKLPRRNSSGVAVRKVISERKKVRWKRRRSEVRGRSITFNALAYYCTRARESCLPSSWENATLQSSQHLASRKDEDPSYILPLFLPIYTVANNIYLRIGIYQEYSFEYYRLFLIIFRFHSIHYSIIFWNIIRRNQRFDST